MNTWNNGHNLLFNTWLPPVTIHITQTVNIQDAADLIDYICRYNLLYVLSGAEDFESHGLKESLVPQFVVKCCCWCESCWDAENTLIMLTHVNWRLHWNRNGYLKRLISIVSLLVLSPTLIGCSIPVSTATNEPRHRRHCDHAPISDVTAGVITSAVTSLMMGGGGAWYPKLLLWNKCKWLLWWQRCSSLAAMCRVGGVSQSLSSRWGGGASGATAEGGVQRSLWSWSGECRCFLRGTLLVRIWGHTERSRHVIGWKGGAVTDETQQTNYLMTTSINTNWVSSVKRCVLLIIKIQQIM